MHIYIDKICVNGSSTSPLVSKTGRPLTKKLKDRKASIRVGPVQNNVTADFTGSGYNIICLLEFDNSPKTFLIMRYMIKVNIC